MRRTMLWPKARIRWRRWCVWRLRYWGGGGGRRRSRVRNACANDGNVAAGREGAREHNGGASSGDVPPLYHEHEAASRKKGICPLVKKYI